MMMNEPLMTLNRAEVMSKKVTKRDMIRYLHSHGDSSFLEKHKCNGRITNLKNKKSYEDLVTAVLELLPMAKSHNNIQKGCSLTPIKNPKRKVLGERNMNTPPMRKLLKHSQKILATSHATQSSANAILAQIENSPSFKKVSATLRVKAQAPAKKPCTPPMTRILKQVDNMMSTSKDCDKVSFALQADLQVAEAKASDAIIKKLKSDVAAENKAASEEVAVAQAVETVAVVQEVETAVVRQRATTRSKKIRRSKTKSEKKAAMLQSAESKVIVAEPEKQSLFHSWIWGNTVAYRIGTFSSVVLLSGLTFQIGSRILRMWGRV